MQYPNVSLNGTSAASLTHDLNEAYHAASMLVAKLHEAMPNARDYTPQGTTEGYDKHRKAVEEMVARVALVRGIQRELEALVENIEAQGGR